MRTSCSRSSLRLTAVRMLSVSASLVRAAVGTGGALESLVANASELAEVRRLEEALVDELMTTTGAVPLVRVPLLGHDVADMAGLDELAVHLR